MGIDSGIVIFIVRGKIDEKLWLHASRLERCL